jgi:hypothetical protein
VPLCIKMDVKGIGCKDAEWIPLALAHMLRNLRVP